MHAERVSHPLFSPDSTSVKHLTSHGKLEFSMSAPMSPQTVFLSRT